MGTFILKGSAVAGTLSDNDIGKAHFVRIVATAGSSSTFISGFCLKFANIAFLKLNLTVISSSP